MVLSAQVFVICISAGMYFFGTELGISKITDYSLNMAALNDTFKRQAEEYDQSDEGGGFNIIFVFGDFTKAITQFMQIVTGHYVFNMMEKFGFAQSFVVGTQVIFGLGVVGSLIYLISGR